MSSEVHDRSRSPTRAEVRRRKLINSARVLFVGKGFHATGVAQIARESGIAVGQIYRDFASKEEIVAAIVEADCARFLSTEALNSAIAAGDEDQVLAWLCRLLEFDGDSDGHRLFAEILAESSRNARIAAIFTEIQSELRTNILAALTLLAPGEERNVSRAIVADMIMTFSSGLFHQRQMYSIEESLPVMRHLQRLIRSQVLKLRAGEFE